MKPNEKINFTKPKNSIKKKITYYLLDHPKQKFLYEYTRDIILSIVSAFLFAYGFRAFTSPPGTAAYEHLISGGASGISQVVVRIVSLFRNNTNEGLDNTLQSVLYFVINIPIIVFAFLKIGKRFTFLTLVNVGSVSLFLKILPDSIFYIMNLGDQDIARALFAGILTGLHSSLAYYIGASAGGIDVVAMYIANKKSTSVGKFSLIINAVTVTCYVLVTILDYNIYPVKIPVASKPEDQFTTMTITTKVVTMALYTLVYYFCTSKVVDVFHTANKKSELQIISSKMELPQILIHAFPHACTVVDAKGAYSGNPLKIIYMVLSYSEVKKAIKIIKEADSKAFTTVTTTHQVYGAFYIKPLK